MKTLRNLSRLQILGLVLIPITAAAVTWGSSPAIFRQAASAAGARVTEVCRSKSASYGARNSPHKSCQAMDLGKETPKSKIALVESFGLKCEYHSPERGNPWAKYRPTGPHYHCYAKSSNASRVAARADQRSRADSIRARNKQKGRGGRSSVSRSQRSKASSIRRLNRERVSGGAQSFFFGEAGAER